MASCTTYRFNGRAGARIERRRCGLRTTRGMPLELARSNTTIMTHALHDLARHNAWATAELITFCQGLDAPTLEATVPGTYGTIIATLRHLVDSEASYLFRLHGVLAGYPWPADDAVGLEVLAERADLLARSWEQFLAGDVDTERRMEARGSDPARYTTRAGVMLAYVFEPRDGASGADLHDPGRAGL